MNPWPPLPASLEVGVQNSRLLPGTGRCVRLVRPLERREARETISRTQPLDSD